MKEIEIGQRFQPTGENGGPRSIWAVERLYDGTDGHRYAILSNAADASLRKTVSFAGLLDKNLFEPCG